MGIKTFAAVAVLSAVLANGPARAANWQPISNGTQTIDINRSQIGQGGNGLVMVWSRASLPQTLADAEGKYNGIEALNRYDCTSHRFVTLKRIYLRDNTLIHVESVLAPKEMDIAAGSIDAAIAADVCKAAPPPSRVIDAATPDAAGVHYADVQKLDSTEPPPFVSVAEATASIGGTKPAAGKSGAADAPPPHRFITLPHIDPSQVQHPTDEPPPAEVTKGSAAAAKREAAKSGVSIEPVLRGLDRHSREVVLATSGPQRKATSRRAAAKQTAADEAEHKDLHWSYEGEGAPSNWGNLRPDFRLCDSGQRQSPIDIHDGIRVDLEPIKFDYHSAMFHIIDNGHTVQVDFGEGNTITVQGRTYRLVQLHFHRPSEERVEGQSFEMVMHLVHKDDDGRLAVIAVLLERGTEHPVIQTFWNNLPLETNVALSPATAVDLNKLLPDIRTYYTYMGSLTTPPCTEGVLWMVMKRPVQLSDDQIAIFTRLYRNNARPVQPANGRLIKESR